MLLVFLNYIYHDAWFRECKEMYTDILCRRRDAITKKRPEECRTFVSFSLTTMFQYTGRFRSRISQNNNVTTLGYLQQSPGLA